MSNRVTGIVAKRIVDHAIGFEGRLPWNIPEDMKFFKQSTTTGLRNICIMGRNTYNSIPNGKLPGRFIYLVSNRNIEQIPNSVSIFPTPKEAMEEALRDPEAHVFVCGGVSIYKDLEPYVHRFLVTNVYRGLDNPADTFFPVEILSNFAVKSTSGIKNGEYEFVEYVRREIPHPDEQYTALARKIISEGNVRMDRTGVGTIGVFGESLKFDLRRGFPIITTKRVFWKGVVEELFWFISGSTDSNILAKKGINIWKGNTSREFLDKLGLTNLREGDIGAGYGFQWRHWGASYEGCDKNYEGLGIDQLKTVLDKIRNNPTDRRILVSAWNVSELKNMCLCPCHMFFQYYVEGEFLDMVMHQRSADLFLGVPFNISSYALLLSLTAHLTGLKPRYLTMNFGDVHVYMNHVTQITEQLSRIPCDLPTLHIENRGQKTWEDLSPTDVSLNSYVSHSTIKADMAV